jgi:hypothetical protein
MILDFLIKIIKYIPLYDSYLKEIKIKKDLINKNKDRIIGKVFNIRKTSVLFK